MRKVFSSAPGKIIITGEHAVVYGETALLASLGLRAKAKLRLLVEEKLRFSSSELCGTREISISEARRYWQKAKTAWNEFDKSSDNRKLVKIRRDPFVVMLCAAGLVMDVLDGIKGGIEIDVESELPIISGFGSSAYIAAVTIGGMGELYGRKWGLEKLNELVFEVEKIMHGRPSGGDPTAVIHGGFIKFQKTESGFNFERLSINKESIPRVFLINSGKASETTGDLVEMVNSRIRNKESGIRRVMENIGKISQEMISDFVSGKFRPDLISLNERLLEKLGVVGDKAKRMIKDIEKTGGAAKICGAGGVKEGSGVMLAYNNDFERLGSLIRKNNWESFETDLGGEGWKLE